MSRVHVAASSIHGTGVFAEAVFGTGEIVLIIDDTHVLSDTRALDAANGEFEHHCDYLANGKVVLMLPPERFINHCCDPNTYIRTIAGDRCVVALQEIHAGEEITYDYRINGDGDTEWTCTCGSAICRKRHRSGFFYLPNHIQARYLALLEDWFVDEHRDAVRLLKQTVEEGPG